MALYSSLSGHVFIVTTRNPSHIHLLTHLDILLSINSIQDARKSASMVLLHGSIIYLTSHNLSLYASGSEDVYFR